MIRSERATDLSAIRAVVTQAFGQPDEAVLIDNLRESGFLAASEVAVVDGAIVGHASLSMGFIGDTRILVLAPVSVVEAHQGRGVGSALVKQILTNTGRTPVTVLGDPAFYRRFGFEPSRSFGITDPVTDDPDHPQIINGELAGPGSIEYAPPFAEL